MRLSVAHAMPVALGTILLGLVWLVASSTDGLHADLADASSHEPPRRDLAVSTRAPARSRPAHATPAAAEAATVPHQFDSSEVERVRRQLISLWEDEVVSNPRFDRLDGCETRFSTTQCEQWRVEAEFSMLSRANVASIDADDTTAIDLLSSSDSRVRLLSLRLLEVSGYSGSLPIELYETLGERGTAEVCMLLGRHQAYEPTPGEAAEILRYGVSATDPRVLERAAMALAGCQHRDALGSLLDVAAAILDESSQAAAKSRCVEL